MIRERLPGFDPREFWASPLPRARVHDMREKYEAQVELAGATEDERKPLLRSIARRWPGSLREAELSGLVVVGERLEQTRRGVEQPERSGDEWRARGESACAVLLWARLHPLLGDLLRFRRASGERANVAALTRWLAGEPEAGERWPGVERLPALVGDELGVRCAYLWLAARAGLGLPRLNGLLFARSGHWDRRPGDPRWAHDDESS